MKDLLKKLLALFKTPAPNKPVEPWPFPVQEKRKPGRPKKTEPLPVKEPAKKKQVKKIAVKKSAKKAK